MNQSSQKSRQEKLKEYYDSIMAFAIDADRGRGEQEGVYIFPSNSAQNMKVDKLYI